MLTTYVFRYTSECTISQSNFQKFLRLRWQGGIEPPNQNPADALGGEEAEVISRARMHQLQQQQQQQQSWAVAAASVSHTVHPQGRTLQHATR